MKTIDIIKKANSHVFKAKTRSVLTILSIVIGALTLTFAIGLGFGVQKLFNAETGTYSYTNTLSISPDFEQVDKEKKNDDGVPIYEVDQSVELDFGYRDGFSLENSELEKIKQLDGVDEVYPDLKIISEYVTLTNYSEQKYLPSIRTYYKEQTFDLLSGTNPVEENDVVVSEKFLVSLEISDPDRLVGESLVISYVSDQGDLLNTQALNIVGIKRTNRTEQAGVFIDYSIRESIHFSQFSSNNIDYNSVSGAIVKLESALDENDVSDAVAEIRDLDLSVYELTGDSTIEQAVGLYLTAGLVMFAAIVIMASFFGIVNTLLMSVYERTRQIGLLKALGLSNFDVFKLFSFEGGIIGFWGGLIGISIGVLTSKILINPFLVRFFGEQDVLEPLQLTFPIVWLLVILMSLVLLSFIAAILPARKAAKLDPIQALRHE